MSDMRSRAELRKALDAALDEIQHMAEAGDEADRFLEIIDRANDIARQAIDGIKNREGLYRD